MLSWASILAATLGYIGESCMRGRQERQARRAGKGGRQERQSVEERDGGRSEREVFESSALQCCAVLCCAVLCCAVLCCAVLCVCERQEACWPLLAWFS